MREHTLEAALKRVNPTVVKTKINSGMSTDEKIYGLMAIAEEQQLLTAELIDLQKEEIDDLKHERKLIRDAHKNALEDVQRRFAKNVHKGWIGATFLCCLFSSAVVLSGTYFYMQQLTKDLNEYQANYDELKAKNADIRTCTRNGKDYPCVRVMKSYGSYGKSGDIFILDPK